MDPRDTFANDYLARLGLFFGDDVAQ
jgi:hypothetical protein